MGIDNRKRHIKQFLRVGRIGKKYYVFGAPDGLDGPYDNSKMAEEVYVNILDNYESYEVVNRKVVKKS